MELCWLEAFLALAETRSIRNAAAQLGVSPATLSDRVTALENHLGVKLLNRGTQGTDLTEQGKLYMTDARKLLSEWQNILRQVQPLDVRPTQILRIAFQEKVLPPVVGRFLDQFLVRHPDIVLSLYNDQDVGIADGLGVTDSSDKGRVDLYFAYSPPESLCAGLVHRPVFHTRLGVLVPNKHPLVWKKAVSLQELDGEIFLIYPETQERSLRERELDALRASGIRFSLFGGYMSPLYYSLPVQMECGVAICPMLMRGHVPRYTTLLPLTDPLCQCSIDMLYHPENDNPTLRLFLEEFGDQEGVDDL